MQSLNTLIGRATLIPRPLIPRTAIYAVIPRPLSPAQVTVSLNQDLPAINSLVFEVALKAQPEKDEIHGG